MAGAETELHKLLKKLAFHWALENGFHAAGFEISLPKSGFRADVAACKKGRVAPGATAVFECKQHRGDFLRDSLLTEKTRSRLQALNTRRATLERLLRVHQPSAVAGDSLFEEFGTLNPDALGHDGYHKVLREIQTLQSGLFTKTKFDDLSRYRTVNLCYLVTTQRLVKAFEIPPFWGHLEQNGDSLLLKRQPVWQETTETNRLAILQKIAVTWTRQATISLQSDTDPQFRSPHNRVSGQNTGGGHAR